MCKKETVAPADLSWLWDKDPWFLEADDDLGGPISFEGALTEDNWKTINDKIVKCPEEARAAFDACIGLYRLTRENCAAIYERKTLQVFEVLTKRLKEVSSSIDDLLSNEEAWKAFEMGIDGYVHLSPEKVMEGKHLGRHLKGEIATYTDWLDKADYRVISNREGGPEPRYGYLDGFIRAIDRVISKFKLNTEVRRAKQGKDSLVFFLFKVADETLLTRRNDDVILAAIKSFMARRPPLDN